MAEASRHAPRLITSLHGHARLHGGFNRWLAVLITRWVGTMWAAYAFTVLAFVSLPQAIRAFFDGDLLLGVTWVSQSFLQLVLLPVIMVGQNVQAHASDARAEADHETLTEILRRLDAR